VKLDSQRVLAGSLNLLTPSDKTPENDAIALQNFRVDQQGVLRVGDSLVSLTQVFSGAHAVHTEFKIDDFSTTQAYVNGEVDIAWGVGLSGAGIGLTGAFLIGAGPTLFFYWPGAFGGAGVSFTVATGFSGNPLSIVVWNGLIWVLDSLLQIKIDPAVLSGIFPGVVGPYTSNAASMWLPAVPSSPVIAVEDTVGDGPLSGTYTYYCTYVHYAFPVVGGFLTALESAGGAATAPIVAAGGAISVLQLPFASTSGGVPVDAIRVYRQLGAGAITFLKQFGTGPDPTGAVCLTYLTSTYPTVDTPWTDTLAASGVVMPVSGAVGAPAAPTSALVAVPGFNVSSSVGLVGTYQYYRTYVNSAGLETNPGPVSADVTPSNGLVDLSWTAPPFYQDVRRQRLYRTGGTLGNAYQVIEFADATTTSYIDGAPDLQLTLNGILMPTTNDPPPTGTAANVMGVVGPYFNALLAWKDGRLFWSQNGIPLFPGSQAGTAEGNWVDVGAPDDPIQMITLHPILCAIHKARSIWRNIGDIVTGTLMDTSATCGAVGKNAVANCGAFDLVLAADGVYKFNLDNTGPVSEKISPVFIGQQWIGLGSSSIVQPHWGTPQYPFCAWLNGVAVIGNGGSFAGDTFSGTTFLYQPELQRWSTLVWNGGQSLTVALGSDNRFQWFAGDAYGNLLIAQPPVRGALDAIWQTRFLDQGLGDTPKFYQEIVLDAELNGATMQVWLLFDNTSDAGALSAIASPYTATFTGGKRQKFYMPLPQDEGDTGEYHISVRTEITYFATEVSVPPAIHGLYIYYGVEERDASIRGTQVLDFHSERIQMCKRIEVDQVGEVTIKIWTDEPNGLALRYTYNGTMTGRSIFEFTLPPNVRGRLYRVDVLPVGEARVYAVRGWMRSVGDAQPGVWEWRDFISGTPAEAPDAE
jgi:hypothetical protein